MKNFVAVESGSDSFSSFDACAGFVERVPPLEEGIGLSMQEVVREYAPLVRRLAYRLMARLPASVQIEDVIQNGMLGLIDSAKRFEQGMGAQFETYATQRIRGAMLDGLRENDWMPRALRRDLRRVESAVRLLEQQHGRAPAEREVADALDMNLLDYQRTLRDARASQMLHFEDCVEEGELDFFEKHLSDAAADPLAQLISDCERGALLGAIAELPERERLMMRLYYEEDLNLREIGEMLGVSESRVCQLHKQAVSRLRAALLDGGRSSTFAAGRSKRALAGTSPATAAQRELARDVELVRERAHEAVNLPSAYPAFSQSHPGIRAGRACNQAVFHAVVG